MKESISDIHVSMIGIATKTEMTGIYQILLGIGSAAICAALLSYIVPMLDSYSIVDLPGKRTNHSHRIPRGGGLAIMPAILAAWGFSGYMLPSDHGFANLQISIFMTAFLFGVSFVDDIRTLSAGVRIATHIAAVMFVLVLAPVGWRIFPEYIPAEFERIVLGVCWIWFINLTNFMDGIDGITGVEVIGITAGIVLVGLVHGSLPIVTMSLSIIVLAAFAAFLFWNWAPAKIFLGDSGSIPTGFIVFGLLIDLAGSGYAAAAIVLPAYYVVDATATLLLRLMVGERIWEAHSTHAYQLAVRRSVPHSRVSGIVAISNAFLILLGIISFWLPLFSIILAYILAGMIYSSFVFGWLDRFIASSAN